MVTKVRSNMVTHKRSDNSIVGLKDELDLLNNRLDLKELTGITEGRPTESLTIGLNYFDETLGLPIWWDGSNWIDATGTMV